MSGSRVFLTSVVGLWIATILQQAVSTRVAVFSARPDFLLVFLSPMSLMVPRGTGAVLGFFCGLLHGAIAGRNLVHFVFSRTVAGFLGSWSKSIGFEVNLGAAVITCFLLTLIARLIYMFSAAPQGVASYLGDTIGSAMYNGVLAIPVYLLLKRILNPRARSAR